MLENGLNNLNYGQVQIDTTVYIDRVHCIHC
eukprot:COSAG05_NODE_26255_length_189_cov_448.022222_2_plen_30_part_01